MSEYKGMKVRKFFAIPKNERKCLTASGAGHSTMAATLDSVGAQDDARALHCRRRAGPGRQHRRAVRVAALLTHPGLQAVEPAAKAVAVLGALHQKRRTCWRWEETELWRPSHRSMLRLLMVEAAEQRESHCAAASSVCLDQPAAAVEPDACR